MMPWVDEVRSRADLAVFIAAHLPFVDENHRHHDVHDEHWVSHQPRQSLRALALDIGAKSWPIRHALAEFVVKDGQRYERELLLQQLTPTTAFLLDRFASRLPNLSLVELCAHPHARFVFRPLETKELVKTRSLVWHQLWCDHRGIIEKLSLAFKKEWTAFASALHSAREALIELDEVVCVEHQELLQALEERIVLRGDRVSMEDLILTR